MFLPWHRYYVQFFEDALTKKCGYKGVQPYWDWTLGNIISRILKEPTLIAMVLHLDAPDFYNSKFFDNSSSGVGGWGDPENDFQITTGGLKDMVLTYPNRHRIRRNFTLYPLANPNFPPPWGNDPSAPPPPGDLMINTTFTRENVDYLINSFEGDFLGFSAYYEAVAVSLAPPFLGFRFGCLTLSLRRGLMVVFTKSTAGECAAILGLLYSADRLL